VHSVIGAVIFVAFIVGCLLGASGKGKNQKEQTDNSDTQHNGAGEKYSIAYWRQYIHSRFSHYKRNRTENRHYRNPNIAWARRAFWVVFFYTAATFVLLFVNYLVVNAAREQARLMRDQLEVAQKTLVMSQRPWLYVKGNINFVMGTADNETLNAEIENNGNVIATDVIIISGYISQRIFGGYVFNQVNGKDISCIDSALTTFFPRRTVAIVPKSFESVEIIIKSGPEKSMEIAPQFHGSAPYLVGCIKYNWPITKGEFHTKFVVRVEIIDQRTGEMVFVPPFPASDLSLHNYKIIPAGQINYVDAD